MSLVSDSRREATFTASPMAVYSCPVVDPTNPYVLEPHLACAAREQPLAEEELEFFGPAAKDAAQRMVERGELVSRRGLLHHRGQRSPHAGPFAFLPASPPTLPATA